MTVTFKQYLTESINDKGIFKAIFMGGSTGAGKTFVMSKLKSGQIEPRIVNTDKALEFFAQKDNIDLSKEYERAYVDRSKYTTQQLLVQYINGMLPLWIDGTSANPSHLHRRVGLLRSYGYDVGMVWVNTDMDTALERMKSRDRQVPEDQVRKIYRIAQDNKQFYKSTIFGQNFWDIDNNDGMLTDDVINKAFNQVTSFFQNDINNPTGQKIVKRAKEHGYKYLSPHFVNINDIQQSVEMWYPKK